SSVTLNIIDNDSAHINFQTDIPQSAGPEFVKDTGQLFGDRGNGLAYGWDADNTANTRIRNNPRSPDFRYDSLARMQSGGVNRTWEIAVPNGLYQVRVVAGDPDFLDSIYKLSLEGSAALTGTPHDDIHWFRRTVNVQVSDGRLTLGNAAGSSNNKICFIDIKAAPLDATVGNATADIGVHLLPPPTARTSAFHWTVGRLFSDQRIEELDSRVAPSARAQIRLAQAILSGTCPTTRPLEATAPTGSSLTPARSLPTSSRPFAI
ncbi:MAG: hypothetical protein ACREJC_05090, partial [Tepidisphaeraceae bacterium]